MTAKQQKEAAEKLGYKPTNYFSKNGPRVYKKGNNYISYDVTSHNGGVWKMGKSVQEVMRKTTRTGTYDANLNKIGD